MADTGAIVLQVVDGAREPFTKDVLVHVVDGNKQVRFADTLRGPIIMLRDLPTFDNTGDFYTVVASAPGCSDAGFFPVKVAPNSLRPVFLMLVPKDGRPNFRLADWDALTTAQRTLLVSGAPGDAAKSRYEDLLELTPERGACLWNILTALDQIHLPVGTALSYFRSLQWDTIARDRFFAIADEELLTQVKFARDQGLFKPELHPDVLHGTASESYKQVAFGEANIQLTFHGTDPAPQQCVVVEPDIDYFQDEVSHGILEVLPHLISQRVGGKGLTNPYAVYVLRWIAGRQAGMPEFAPPYTLV
jgi:hypothetical protein